MRLIRTISILLALAGCEHKEPPTEMYCAAVPDFQAGNMKFTDTINCMTIKEALRDLRARVAKLEEAAK